MDPAYLYKLPSGTSIFRAKTIAKEGRWYALSLEDAYIYGNTVTEYSTTKELNLLNIMSLTFHYDFIDRLNTLYPGKDNIGIDIDKLKCLVPLGLIDIKSQKIESELFGLKLPINETRWNDILELTSLTLQNRHRLSEHTLDTHLVSILEKIYGSVYDGYISPLKWPTKIHGDFFPREACLFKLGNVKEEKEYTKSSASVGGAIIIPPISINMDIFRKYEESIHEFIKENKFKPIWNPHTEDTNIYLKKRVTRRKKRL